MEPDAPWQELFSAMKDEAWEDAIHSIDNLIRSEPTDPEHFIKLGDIYQSEGNPHDALSAYRDAVELYKVAGFVHKAVPILKKILDIDPKDPEAKKALDTILKKEGGASLTVRINTAFNRPEAGAAGTVAIFERLISSGKAPELIRQANDSGALDLFAEARAVEFSPGTVIIREGEEGSSIFVVVSGAVEVSSVVQARKIVLTTLYEGDVFGEMAFLTSKPRSATVSAVSGVTVIELRRGLIERLVDMHPHLLRHLYSMYTSRLEVMLGRIKGAGEQLSGSIAEFPPADVLQVLDQLKKEGCLSVRSADGPGMIGLKQGMITDIRFGDFEGEDALIKMLSLTNGSFSFEPGPISATESARPIGFVLMDGMRLMDEKAALSGHLPDTGDRIKLVIVPADADSDTSAVISAMRSGAATLQELFAASGLSRIRVELAVARLIRGGYAVPAAGI